MSFLLGDDYASSNSSESDSEEDVPVVSRANDQGETSSAVAAPALLPSADSVLDSVGSSSKRSFLPPTYSDTPKQVVEAFDHTKDAAPTAADENEDEQEKTAEDQAFVSSRPPPRQQRKPQDQQQSASKRPLAADKSGLPNKREKLDGKERVKAQRVKGQAGIGSDFRHWKSETEMAMRQQFD